MARKKKVNLDDCEFVCFGLTQDGKLDFRFVTKLEDRDATFSEMEADSGPLSYKRCELRAAISGRRVLLTPTGWKIVKLRPEDIHLDVTLEEFEDVVREREIVYFDTGM